MAAPTGEAKFNRADKYRASVTARPVLSMRAPKAKSIPPKVLWSAASYIYVYPEAFRLISNICIHIITHDAYSTHISEEVNP
ncbi:hypothetical protein D3C80_2128250 [compost metagenome]